LPSKPYQLDLFGEPVVDLATERIYRRGQLPSDLAAAAVLRHAARPHFRIDELAALLGTVALRSRAPLCI
jgi:hypothetical protein